MSLPPHHPFSSKVYKSMAFPLSLSRNFPHASPLSHSKPRASPVLFAVSTPERKGRRKKQSSKDDESSSSSSSSFSSSSSATVSTAEKGLRFTFMEELVERARKRDSAGVTDVIYDMVAAGLSPGPRSFHGLIVSQTLSGDEEGAVSPYLPSRNSELAALSFRQ